MANKIMKRLKYPGHETEVVTKLVRWHMFFSDPEQITLSAVRRMIRNVGEDNIWDLLNLRICDRIGTGRPKEQPFRFRKYKSYVEEALRSPTSVGMLAINGDYILKEMGQKPGPRIGWALHALLEEVLEDPKKNELETLKKRTEELFTLPDEELKELGEAGKKALEKEEKEAVAAIRAKHHVN